MLAAQFLNIASLLYKVLQFDSPFQTISRKAKGQDIRKAWNLCLAAYVQFGRDGGGKSKSLGRPLWNGIQTNPSSNIQHWEQW